jgi:hypothetical protein
MGDNKIRCGSDPHLIFLVFAQPATDCFPDLVAVQDYGQLAIFIGLQNGMERGTCRG